MIASVIVIENHRIFRQPEYELDVDPDGSDPRFNL
jgi:hypothetical protein